MTSNRQQFTFKKLIKENAMLEDFNKQNSRILENQDTLKQEDK